MTVRAGDPLSLPRVLGRAGRGVGGGKPHDRTSKRRPLSVSPAEVGYIRLRPTNSAEIGQARFRMQAGERTLGPRRRGSLSGQVSRNAARPRYRHVAMRIGMALALRPPFAP